MPVPFGHATRLDPQPAGSATHACRTAGLAAWYGIAVAAGVAVTFVDLWHSVPLRLCPAERNDAAPRRSALACAACFPGLCRNGLCRDRDAVHPLRERHTGASAGRKRYFRHRCGGGDAAAERSRPALSFSGGVSTNRRQRGAPARPDLPGLVRWRISVGRQRRKQRCDAAPAGTGDGRRALAHDGSAEGPAWRQQPFRL